MRNWKILISIKLSCNIFKLLHFLCPNETVSVEVDIEAKSCCKLLQNKLFKYSIQSLKTIPFSLSSFQQIFANSPRTEKQKELSWEIAFSLISASFSLSNYDNKLSVERFIFSRWRSKAEYRKKRQKRQRQTVIAILKFQSDKNSQIHFPLHKNWALAIREKRKGWLCSSNQDCDSSTR